MNDTSNQSETRKPFHMDVVLLCMEGLAAFVFVKFFFHESKAVILFFDRHSWQGHWVGTGGFMEYV